MNWHDYFYYDETSPSCLRWKVDCFSGKSYSVKHISAGDIAGSKNASGYWQVKIGEANVQVHRIIIEMFGNHLPPNAQVDHSDHNRRNNCITNLRVVSKRTNLHNKSQYENNATGVTGVLYRERTIADKLYCTFTAIWKRVDGKQRSKDFSTNKYGYDQAFRLACEYRTKMITELNAQGAGYTDSHGT